MANKGSIPTVNGRGMVRKNGTLSVANANGKCPNCCCKPKILATYTTINYGVWDLTPYQGDNQVASGGCLAIAGNPCGTRLWFGKH